MNTFGSKRPRNKDITHLGTLAHHRQLVGAEKHTKMADATVKSNTGTPAYKSQEEYYDQILEYKKQVANMNQEMSALKAKIRRLEEDNLKKDKEIDALLNPHKSEELRRTLSDKKPDSGAVIHSLKQKILKLETQMRDKEASYAKLQSDLKTTKIDEMKTQMDMFYSEIVRLQNAQNTGLDKTIGGKDRSVKIKALNETVLRLNKSNEQLQAENQSLKEDLKIAIDDTIDVSLTPEFNDMSRNELLQTVLKMKKKLEGTRRQLGVSSVLLNDGKATHKLSKIVLEGSLNDRMHQLNDRETELLDIIEKMTLEMRDLVEENNQIKKRCEEMDKVIISATRIQDHDVKPDLVRRRPQSASRPPSARSVTSKKDDQRLLSARSNAEQPPSAREPSLSSRSEQAFVEKSAKEANARPPSAKRSSSIESSASSAQQKKVQNFKEKRSALIIQKQWRSHKDAERTQNDKINHFREERAARKIQKYWTGYQYKQHEHEQDEAAEVIQSTFLGHRSRQHQMQRYHSETDDANDTDEERSQSVDLIQSVILGYQQCKTKMRETRSSSTSTDDEKDNYKDVDGDNIASDIIDSSTQSLASSQRSNRPSLPSLNRTRPSSGASKVSVVSGKGSSIHSMPSSRLGAHPSNFGHLDNDDF